MNSFKRHVHVPWDEGAYRANFRCYSDVNFGVVAVGDGVPFLQFFLFEVHRVCEVCFLYVRVSGDPASVVDDVGVGDAQVNEEIYSCGARFVAVQDDEAVVCSFRGAVAYQR